MRALWLPYSTADLDAATRFYTGLGLTEVDGWERDGERGVVLRVPGTAYVELVSPGPATTWAPEQAPTHGPAPTWAAGPNPTHGAARAPGPPAPVPLAFEFAARAAVDAEHRRLGGRAPGRYPRGHYGFDLAGPDGTPLMIWSET
ncbi:VOC family protein [Longispora urticae]